MSALLFAGCPCSDVLRIGLPTCWLASHSILPSSRSSTSPSSPRGICGCKRKDLGGARGGDRLGESPCGVARVAREYQNPAATPSWFPLVRAIWTKPSACHGSLRCRATSGLDRRPMCRSGGTGTAALRFLARTGVEAGATLPGSLHASYIFCEVLGELGRAASRILFQRPLIRSGLAEGPRQFLLSRAFQLLAEQAVGGWRSKVVSFQERPVRTAFAHYISSRRL